MGCGASKEAVVTGSGRGKCNRKLFQRKSSIVATGVHQPSQHALPSDAAKDKVDEVKDHKATSTWKANAESDKAGVGSFKDGNKVMSAMIGVKVIGEKKEEIKKDEVINGNNVVMTDEKAKQSSSEKVTEEKKEAKNVEGVKDKEAIPDQKNDVASIKNVIIEEKEKDITDGEAIEVTITAASEEKRDEVLLIEAIDEAALSTKKDITETKEDGGSVIFTSALVAQENDSATFPTASVAGDDGGVTFVAAPVAKEVDSVIFPATPVTEDGNLTFVDAPVAKEDGSVTLAAATTTNGEESNTFVATPMTEDVSVPVAATLVTKEDDNITFAVVSVTKGEDDSSVTFAAAPVTNDDEILTFSAALVAEEEVVQQPKPFETNDLRNEQELPEPIVIEKVVSKVVDEAEEGEVVTVEEVIVEQQEESVSREPEEEEKSTAALRDDDGESDGKRAINLKETINT